MLRHLPLTTSLILLVLPAMSVWAGGQSSGDQVQARPDRIQVGMFYSGRDIQVTASTPACEDVVIRVTGRDEPVTLKRKGKKYGVLWMNVGEVHYDAVPTLYIVRSTRELGEIAAPETLRRLKIGFDALRDLVPAESEDGAREFFGELVKLKERDHLFSSEAPAVQRHSAESGRQEVTSEFLLPAKAPVGDYTIDVFAFQDGNGTLVGTANVHLRRSVAVASITSLATSHGLLYGCIAVAIAVLAGLSTGVIFGMGKGGSH